MNKEKRVFILRDSSVRDTCKTYLDTLSLGADENPYKVTVELYKKNRSTAQNNLMWMWLTKLSNYLRNEAGLQTMPDDLRALMENLNPDDLKDHFQRTYLGYRTYSFDGQHYVRLRGTSDLNTAEFTELLNRIEEYASNAGLNLPHPEDLYYEAMGIKQ